MLSSEFVNPPIQYNALMFLTTKVELASEQLCFIRNLAMDKARRLQITAVSPVPPSQPYCEEIICFFNTVKTHQVKV
jgi:hypothetical protein